MQDLTEYLKALNTAIREQLPFFVSGSPHSLYLERHRMAHIVGRARIVAAVMAVLFAAWIVVDYLAFEWPLWGALAGMRMGLSFIFVVLALPLYPETTPRVVFTMLIAVMLAPSAFYLVSQPLFADAALSSAGEVCRALYPLLPFMMIAVLAVFPLTLVEVLVIGLPLLAVIAYGTAVTPEFQWIGYLRDLWLAFLFFSAVVVACVAQLKYMISFIERTSFDPLTGAFTRTSGSEVFDIQFNIADRMDSPFAVAFFDLDNFKTINDTFGHEAGDRVLKQMSDALRHNMRRSDAIVRWGGEEFVMMLPNTDAAGIRVVLERIMGGWFGDRPDGEALTASIGIAERKSDQQNDWLELVALADRRMYMAKKQGRARAISVGDEPVTRGDFERASAN